MMVSVPISCALTTPVMADVFTITSGTATNDNNVINGNDTVTITGALVTPAGNRSIEITGNNNTINVSETGSIEAAENLQLYVPPYTQNPSGAIYNGGENNNINVSGSINTSGSDAIKNDDSHSQTNVSGSITTVDGSGIVNRRGNNETNVSGTISTDGVSSAYGVGIDNAGSGNETIVSGTISTTGSASHGVYEYDSNNYIYISGSITTEGDGAKGIYNYNSDDDGNEIILSGSITTTGDRSEGIYNDDDNNEITVSGNITTFGDRANGIESNDYDAILVSGSITTSGDISNGIASGAYGAILASGSITTSGDNSNGISIQGESEITVSGSIITQGEDSHGMVLGGGNTITTISGTVKSTGPMSAALYQSGGDESRLTLNEGTIIIGDILADDGATNTSLIFNLGASTSYAYSVSGRGVGTSGGQWTFSDIDGRNQLVTISGTGCDTTISGANNDTCNLVTAVGNGNAETQNEQQYFMNSSMIGSLSPRIEAAGSDDGMLFPQESQSNAWANFYAGSSRRDSSPTGSLFKIRNHGLTIGVPVPVNESLNLDLLFNTANASLGIGSNKDQDIAVKSYNVGAALRDLAPSTNWAVDAFGFVGRNFYDGKRMVMNNQEATGFETVTAAYSGMEVLVGIDAQYSNPINGMLNLIGGINANLSRENVGAYSESRYFSWDPRALTQASGGITAGVEYNKEALTTFANFGLQRSSLKSGKEAIYTNNGIAGSFTDSSTDDTRRLITIGFNYLGSESMTLGGALEASSSKGGMVGNSASLSANWRF